MLQDIAILTGGQVVSEDLGIKLENVTLDMLGSCKTITISKDDTLILDGAGDKTVIEERADLLRESIENTSSEYEREKLQERLAKLSGGVAVIKVGGASDVEVNEKKDRVTDALNATRAAVEEGIVPGGGSALLFASKSLEGLRDGVVNRDQKTGVEIVQRAVRSPAMAIANNAGVEGAVVVGKLLEQTQPEIGYDAQNEEYVNMIDRGIIDPTKVTRTALVDAASVAGLMMTTETFVVELPKEEPPAPPMGGGMGGMPGMGGGMGF